MLWFQLSERSGLRILKFHKLSGRSEVRSTETCRIIADSDQIGFSDLSEKNNFIPISSNNQRVRFKKSERSGFRNTNFLKTIDATQGAIKTLPTWYAFPWQTTNWLEIHLVFLSWQQKKISLKHLLIFDKQLKCIRYYWIAVMKVPI